MTVSSLQETKEEVAPASLPTVSVIVPVTDANAPLRELVPAYTRALTEAGYPHDIVIVLDGVRGAIETELKAMAATMPIKVVRLQGSGLGEPIALAAGVERSSGDLIVCAPQYLQAEPGDLVKVARSLDQGADCVATWRHPRIDPWLNRLQSSLFNSVLRWVMGVRFHDLNSSLRGLRRHVLQDVSVYGDLYRFLPVLAQRQGFKVVEIQVRHREERGQAGFYGLGVYARRLLDVLAITFLTRFTQKPLRFFGMLGFAAMALGILLCALPLWEKIIKDLSLTDRPLFYLGILAIAFGVQLLGFGLVGEIIIFTQAKHLSDFKVEDEEAEGPQATASSAGGGPASLDAMMMQRFAPVARPPELLITDLLPGEDARWDAFVRRHPHGTFFHLTGWRKVVEDTFHHHAYPLVAEHARRVVGVLPLFLVKSPFLGKHLISTPYAVYGGLLAEDEAAERLLLQRATELGKQLEVGYIELRHLEPRASLPAGVDGRDRSDLYVTFRMRLPEKAEEVLPAIPKKARAEVRRARDKFGMTFHAGGSVRKLYDLFAINKRRLGSPSLPRRWFEGLEQECGRHVVVHEVRTKDDEVVAAVMSFLAGDTVYAYYSGSDERFHRTGMMDFIYCKIMEWGVENGYRTFDFGRSRKDSGAASFKRNMGFVDQAMPYDYLLIGDGAKLPEFHPSNPKLALPRRAWAVLPLFMTTWLGGKLSRYLP